MCLMMTRPSLTGPVTRGRHTVAWTHHRERRAVSDEERAGVSFSHLDQPLFDEAGATKRDLVDYLDAVGRPDRAGARATGRCR